MYSFVFKVLGEADVDSFYAGEHKVFGNFEAWSKTNCLSELTSSDRYYIGLYAVESTELKTESTSLIKSEIAEKYKQNYGYSIVDSKFLEEENYDTCELVAWAGITTFNDSDLMTIAVLDSYRGMGLATYLLEELLEKARSLKLRTMFLEVRESNDGAIHIYEKLGFKKIGKRKNYYKSPLENAVIMECAINKIGVVGAEILSN